ncbi:XkdX family protein [Bacillus velezensis]|uniref:XkdX family protein n=1 Tax=Bacillus amyloliquefaciens group TaxID=1938374 RepID=UPI001404B438|nr:MULTISPECIES: XkdX family protein [Bacillus amyloliquefaciens group]NHN22725.1 XkdX family protein [Bacillus amyloliquefaciens]NMP61912.1 XkdX family protein [Bacillus velezensis]NRG14347.1 XkdX family protein [Bacillus velezensis]
MIDWFSDIKYFYEKKLWTKEQVYNVVGKRITPEQYKEITGDEYIEGSPPSEGTAGETDGSVGTDTVNQESDTTETAPVSE